MKSNHPFNWQVFPQQKPDFRQPEESQYIEKNSTELELMRKLYDSLPCICFTLNSAGVVLSVSQFGASYLGYETAELIQKPVASVFHLEDQASCQAKLTELQQLPTYISQWSGRQVCKNGNIIWVKAIARLVPGTESAPIILLVCEDITEHKQAEERRQTSNFLQTIIDHLPVAVSVKDGKEDRFGEFRLWNKTSEMIFGLTSQQAIGKTVYDYFPKEQADFFYQKDRQAFERGTPEDIPEEPIDSHSLGRRIVHTIKVPIYDENHDPQYLLCISEDITERKQAEETLRQQFLRERLVGAISQRIHQSLNLEKILNTTVAEVREFLNCDRVIIFRINADGSGVVVVESVNSKWIPISGTIINDRYFAEGYIKLYQQGRVQAVEDIYAAGLTQCHIDLLAKFQARANLVVPIVQEEKLWGLLVAQQCGETRRWQPLEIDLLKSLSTQAAIAIQQSELYQQAQIEITQRQQAEVALQQQFQRERLIGAITQRIRKSLNLEKILNATVAEVRQVLACDRVVIFRFEPDWSGNVVVESVDQRWSPILGAHIYDPCFNKDYVLPYQQGRVKAIEDIYTANLGQCHLDLLTRFQVRANLVVPILNGEQLWGLLIAHHCSKPRQWQQFEIDLLCSLASQVAIAIQQSQLYEQAKSHARREQALNQVTQVIRSSLDLNTIFSTAVCEIGSLLQVDRAQITQYLPERKVWLNVSEYRKRSDMPVALGLEIPAENNEISDRLKRLEIVRIDDSNNFEDKINQGVAQTFPGAWLLLPLYFGDKLWGSIGLVRDTHPYHWQDWEVELICAVADQVAIAIHQAELYHQSRTATATALTQTQQLEQTLQELQRTQTQLVQSEKMSSLGQLVAGVAHEINNPVSFIYGNLTHAGGYIQDLLGLIQLYQQQYPNPTPDIESEIIEIDLDFLIEDLPKLLDSMKVGAERICEIVYSLRSFSRLAEAEMKAVDIHEGLDSTLTILQNRLKAQGKQPRIEVIKDYGNLPKVECYAGELNQVFMNLLSNAIDALEELNVDRLNAESSNPPSNLQASNLQPASPCIRISTKLLNNHQVVIRIADNGPGMTAQVKAKLFDPFFTTKPVGVGTGLGLSISYQIVVEKHGGQLDCHSQLGQGTEFVIQIPLCQQDQEPQIFLAQS